MVPTSPNEFTARAIERIRGRFPSELVDGDEEDFRSSRIASDFSELLASISSSLREQLANVRRIEDSLTFKELIEAYSSQLSVIQKVAQEWTQFLKTLIAIDREFDQLQDFPEFDGQKEIEAWQDEILRAGKPSMGDVPNSLTARIAAMPLNLAKENLRTHTVGFIGDFAHQAGEQLIRLVELQALGLVEWYGPTACTFNYYRRTFLFVAKDSQKINSSFERKGDGYLQSFDIRVGIDAHKSLDHRIHHLANARSLRLEETTLAIPSDASVLIDSVPIWIREHIRIVEGDLFRQIAIKQDLGVESTEYIKRDNVEWHFDPAIILGPFVLTGWSETDYPIEKDEGDTTSENSFSYERQRKLFSGLAVFVLAYLVLAASSSTFGVVLGAVLVVVSFVIFETNWEVALHKNPLALLQERYLWVVPNLFIAMILNICSARLLHSGFYFESFVFGAPIVPIAFTYIRTSSRWRLKSENE